MSKSRLSELTEEQANAVQAWLEGGWSWDLAAQFVEENYGIPTSRQGLQRWAKKRGAKKLPAWENPERRAPQVVEEEARIPWGMGRARLATPSTREPWERIAWLGDLHVPYQDEAIFASALDVVRDWQPHRLILGGDWNDFFQLSRFNVGQERLDELQNEIDEGNEYRRRAVEAANGAVVDELEGNHDSRLITYVRQQAKPLHTLRALEPAVLFNHAELGITMHPGCGFLLRPWFLVKHGTIVRGEAGATAKAELMQAGVSGMSGHTHRLSTYTKSGYVERSWTESGCLCRIDPDYVKGGVPNWRQGMVLGEFSTTGEAYQVQEVPAVDGAMRVIGHAR